MTQSDRLIVLMNVQIGLETARQEILHNMNNNRLQASHVKPIWDRAVKACEHITKDVPLDVIEVN